MGPKFSAIVTPVPYRLFCAGSLGLARRVVAMATGILIASSLALLGCMPVESLPSSLETDQDFLDRPDRPDRNPHFLAFTVAYAYPQYVFQGQAVTLNWHAPLAEWVDVGGAGRFNGPTGSLVVYPNATQEYVITAHNQHTSTPRMINVQVIPLPGAVREFWGDPAAIAIGDTGYLRWLAEYCDYVEIREDGANTPFYRGNCGIPDEVRVQPTRRTRYFIEAFQNDRGVPTGPGYAGPGTDSTGIGYSHTGLGIPRLVGRSDIWIDVLDKTPIVELNASSLSVTAGQPVNIFWSVQNGEGITFDPPIVANPAASGSTYVTLDRFTSIRLSAYSKLLRQRVDRVIDINVTPRFKMNSVQILPEAIEKGRAGIISWSSVQCQKVWITKVSGELLMDNLPCEGTFEVKPDGTSQYVVRFLYNEAGVARVQEVPVTATVYGGQDVAVPQPPPPTPAPAPSLPPPPSQPEIAKSPQPVVTVPDPKDVPRFIAVSASSYSIAAGATVKIQWKTYRTRRVLLMADDQVITLGPHGTYDLKLAKTGPVYLVAENYKYRSVPTVMQIEVKAKSPLEILLEAMGAKP